MFENKLTRLLDSVDFYPLTGYDIFRGKEKALKGAISIRKNIEKLLFESGLSGNQIAKESGVPQSTVSRFLTGESRLDNMKLITAELLNDYYIKLKEDTR